MGNCATDPRPILVLTAMSLVLLLMLRRSGAFHSASAFYSRGRGVAAATGPEGTLLPEVVHKTVSVEELKAEVIVVGDVHGCYSEMVCLLDKCGYRLGNREDKERFSVVLAGDLVNKGPNSVDVVRTAREEGFLAVRGNHDNFALAAATGVGRYAKDSATSKEGSSGWPWVKQLSSEDLEWLSALPYTLSFPSLGCIVVHAGLVPGVDLQDQDAEAMSCMRNVVETEGGGGYEPRTPATEGVAWAKVWKGPEHVYFGHDAKRGFQKEAFATGLDTGCVYGRSLTAVILPGRKVVCIPAEAVWSAPG